MKHLLLPLQSIKLKVIHITSIRDPSNFPTPSCYLLLAAIKSNKICYLEHFMKKSSKAHWLNLEKSTGKTEWEDPENIESLTKDCILNV